jgi:hypothetical protein
VIKEEKKEEGDMQYFESNFPFLNKKKLNENEDI